MASYSGRVNLLVSDEAVDAFETLLDEATRRLQVSNECQIERAAVKGQSLELAEFTKLVLALGGGAGIAMIVKAVAQVVIEIVKARRGKVVLQKANGEKISFENYTAEEVEALLSQVIGG